MNKKQMYWVIAVVAAIGLLRWAAPYYRELMKDSWTVGERTPLDRLASHLSSHFRRSLDKDDFELYYTAESPDTIVVHVRYRDKVASPFLNKVITAAEDNARGVAQDQFGLRIRTQVDKQPAAGE